MVSLLISENEEKLKNMLNIGHQWSTMWRMSLNTEKSKRVHYRNQIIDLSNFVFKYGNKIISYCNEYKYLGLRKLIFRLHRHGKHFITGQ